MLDTDQIEIALNSPNYFLSLIYFMGPFTRMGGHLGLAYLPGGQYAVGGGRGGGTGTNRIRYRTSPCRICQEMQIYYIIHCTK